MHVAHAHDEGVDPAAAEARQQAERDADHHRQHHRRDARRPARCARRTSSPRGCRGPGRRCRAGTWCCPRPPRPAAGARRAAPASPGRTGCAARPRPANSAQNTQTSAIGRGQRSPPARCRKLYPTSLSSQPNSVLFIAARSRAPPGRSGCGAHRIGTYFAPLTDIHLNEHEVVGAAAPARPSSSRPRPAPAGAAAGGRCRRAWILKASLIIALRLVLSVSRLDRLASARRPSGCSSCPG